mmetsp:Transcript_22463/g.53027  ORF Transcript_22463/g.53027 Transcript_22463/m.53027 type:complete len:96 (-) Transcript_22463:26-313(-)
MFEPNPVALPTKQTKSFGALSMPSHFGMKSIVFESTPESASGDVDAMKYNALIETIFYNTVLTALSDKLDANLIFAILVFSHSQNEKKKKMISHK